LIPEFVRVGAYHFIKKNKSKCISYKFTCCLLFSWIHFQQFLLQKYLRDACRKH